MARPKLDTPNYSLGLRGPIYYVVWHENGRKQRVSTGKTDRNEAQIWLAQFIAGKNEPAIPDNPTVSVILQHYLDDQQVKGKVSLRRQQDCAVALTRHLGDLLPEHLTKEQIRFYGRRRTAEGYLVGPKNAKRKKAVQTGTILRELLILRQALKLACEDKLIKAVPKIEVPEAPKGRDRWLTREEAERLLAATVQYHVKLFILLALHTAHRSSAVLELTWDRVHLDRGVIDMGEGRGNKRRNVVPINATLRPYLEEAREAATCPFVVEHGSSRVLSCKKGFQLACARAGITGASPHTLRHTAVTWMVIAGVPYEVIGRYAAMSVEMVETRYGKHSPDYLRQAAQALA